MVLELVFRTLAVIFVSELFSLRRRPDYRWLHTLTFAPVARKPRLSRHILYRLATDGCTFDHCPIARPSDTYSVSCNILTRFVFFSYFIMKSTKRPMADRFFSRRSTCFVVVDFSFLCCLQPLPRQHRGNLVGGETHTYCHRHSRPERRVYHCHTELQTQHWTG